MEEKLEQCLPNFFILGAAKSGTTTLYEILKKHPDIHLPLVKEPQYFCNDSLYGKGLEYYSKTFFKGASKYKLRGDATPHYIYFEKVARRIHEDLPEANHRFIVILRNPVQRAYSLYWNMVREGLENLTFEDALKEEERRLKDAQLDRDCSLLFSYIHSGLYARQLSIYFNYFDRDKFLILFQDDLNNNPSSVFSDICRFLNIRDWDFEITKRHNAASMTRSKALHKFIRGNSFIKKVIGYFIPHKLKYIIVAALIGINKKKFKYKAIDVQTEEMLKAIFSPDVHELEKITGRNLSAWVS